MRSLPILLIGIAIGFGLGIGSTYLNSSTAETSHAVNNIFNHKAVMDSSSNPYIGKSAVSGGLKYTILNIQKSTHSIDGGIVFDQTPKEASDGAIFLIVTMRIENVGNTQLGIPAEFQSWNLGDSKNRSYRAGTTDMPYDHQFALYIQPGLSKSGSIGYEVPDDPRLSFYMPILGQII